MQLLQFKNFTFILRRIFEFVKSGLCHNCNGLILKYTATFDCWTITKNSIFSKTTTAEYINCYCPLLLFYCHAFSGISLSIQLLDCFQNQQRHNNCSGNWSYNRYIVISQTIKLLNKSNQLIGRLFTISDKNFELLL